MELNKIYQGDALELLKEIPDDSIDLICTDPPYGYSFMGKDWDKVVIPTPYWKEALRVLKPGAFAFVMSAPRQDVLSRAIVNLQDAGFETGFSSVYWAYASGFPKASNISLMIDKKACREQLTEQLGRPPTKEEFKKAWGEFREVIGQKIAPDGKPYSERQPTQWTPQFSDNVVVGAKAPMETIPATPQAKALNGSYGGFQPKPAVEVIIVAMKPLSEKTYVDQALANRKGITWLDDVRIPYESEEVNNLFGTKSEIPEITDEEKLRKYTGNNEGNDSVTGNFGVKEIKCNNEDATIKGRFPANLLVSDDVLNVRSEGALAPVKSGQKGFGGIIYGKYATGGDDGASFYSDKETSKSFSRYFDLDKWWEKKVSELPKEVQKVFPFLIVPKASKSEKNKGLGFNPISNRDKYNGKFPNSKADKEFTNKHPTVKPLKLMSLLITLGSRKGDTILDPFAGSGSTLISAKLLGRNYIGFELNEEYVKIAEARLRAVPEPLTKWAGEEK